MKQTSSTTPSWWDKFWKDTDGRVVLCQVPNVWILLWVVLSIVSMLTSGMLASVLRWLASLNLAVWAVLEITTGVNYFRRSFGLIVLLLTIGALVTG